MQRRGARFAILVLVLTAGAVAAVTAWHAERKREILAEANSHVSAVVARAMADLAELNTNQVAYLVAKPNQAALDRADTLLEQLSTTLTTLKSRTRADEGTRALQAAANALAMLNAADARARERLHEGAEFTATEVVFGDARQASISMNASLQGMRDAERARTASQRAEIQRHSWIVQAGAGVVWLIGLLLLARAPRQSRVESEASTARNAADTASDPASRAFGDTATTDVPPMPNLVAAADLCIDMSRMTSATVLPELLARAAALLDASGVIVWMAAGEELFATIAHGYDPRVIARLGPIGRAANNATAAAWRSGEVRTVAGDATSNGAIVAPMFGPDNCIGVLAAEVRHGREHDIVTRAITAIVAAQLATVVAAWPAGSVPHPSPAGDSMAPLKAAGA